MTTLLMDCAVIPGGTDAAIEDGAVRIDGRRIAAVGGRAELGSAAGEEVVSLGGAHLLPGLWDAHIHLGSGVPPHEATLGGEDEGHLFLRCLRKAQDNLRCGITSLRALGDRLDADIRLRDAIVAGLVEGPRILASGDVRWSLAAAGPDEFRRNARRLIHRGVDQVKIMATGGIPFRGDSIAHTICTLPELTAAAEEAHRWNLPLVVHAMADDSVEMACRAGADCVEHGFDMGEAGVAALRAHGVTYCPNLAVTDAWHPNRLCAGCFPDWFVANATQASRRHHRTFTAAIEAGVEVVAGVDCLREDPFTGGIEACRGRIGLVHELRLMVERGLAPRRVWKDGAPIGLTPGVRLASGN